MSARHASLAAVLVLGIAIAIVLTMPAKAPPAETSSAKRSSGCDRPPASRRFKASLVVNGVQRSALVNVPARGSRHVPRPVVLAFHGARGNSESTEAAMGLSELGNRAGFITVYPNADGPHWDLAGPRQNDVTFVRLLLDTLDSTLCIDDNRIYGTGGSNGGSFVAYLGCVLSDRLEAVAPVAGGHSDQPSCKPARPISVLEIHGTRDRVVPYGGRGPNGEGSVSSFLDQWYHWDACPRTTPVWRRLGPRALWMAKAACAGGTTVAHIKLIGEPHEWPTTKTSMGDQDPGLQFSARQAVWEFFSTRTVSPQPPP